MLAATWIQVHEGRLGHADERTRRGEQDDRGGEQRRESRGQARPERGDRERTAADGHQDTATAAIGEHADRRIDEESDPARDAEDQPDLGVRQPEVVLNLRPCCLTRTEDELV